MGLLPGVLDPSAETLDFGTVSGDLLRCRLFTTRWNVRSLGVPCCAAAATAGPRLRPPLVTCTQRCCTRCISTRRAVNSAMSQRTLVPGGSWPCFRIYFNDMTIGQHTLPINAKHTAV